MASNNSGPDAAAATRVPFVLFAHNVEHVIWQRMREVLLGL